MTLTTFMTSAYELRSSPRTRTGTSGSSAAIALSSFSRSSSVRGRSLRKITLSLLIVTALAFLFLVGSSSVFACGSMIETPCSSSGSVTINVTSSRKVRSISEVMSTFASALFPRLRLCLRLRDILRAPSLEFAGDASDQLVCETLHLGRYGTDRLGQAGVGHDAGNRHQKSDDRRHERGGDRRRDRRKVGAAGSPHRVEGVQNAPDRSEKSEHRFARDHGGDEAHAFVKPQFLLVELVLAGSADELDLAGGQRGRTVAVSLASDQERADVGRQELEEPFARLLVDLLEPARGRRTALEIVLEHVAPGGEVVNEPPRGVLDEAEFLRLSDDDREHHHGAEKLCDDDRLPHETGDEESVDQRVCE